MQISNHFRFGYCKNKENCVKKHMADKCKNISTCKSKVCIKRHPKICKRFSVEKFCKFGPGCAYLHLLDPSVDIVKQKDIQTT